jgi:hypothetical protein
MSAAARELNLDIQTVRRFAKATCVEELPGKAEHRSTKLDPYIDLVNQRWNEGVTNARAITAELRALGFKGDAQTVRRYLQPLRLPGTSRSHRFSSTHFQRFAASNAPDRMLRICRIVPGFIGRQTCRRQPASLQSCPGPGRHRRTPGASSMTGSPATTAVRSWRTTISPSPASSRNARCSVDRAMP